MKNTKLYLVDKNNQQKAEILVESCTDNLVQGVIIAHSFDEGLQHKINEFEDLVNTFTLTLLDDAIAQLEAYQWEVQGKNWVIYDFQVFEMKHISFRIKNDK